MLNPERYLCINIPFYVKKSLAKFRCSNHKFLIETGRHFGIKREQQICQFTYLNLQCIEDEFHVFFICNKFQQQRQQYILSWYDGRFEYNKCCILMTIKSCHKHFYVHAIMRHNTELKLYFVFYYDLLYFGSVAFYLQ